MWLYWNFRAVVVFIHVKLTNTDSMHTPVYKFEIFKKHLTKLKKKCYQLPMRIEFNLSIGHQLMLSICLN